MTFLSNQGKFVAAKSVTRDAIVLEPSKALGKAPQQFVASGMTVLVVDAF